jgi:hypothetical protein
MIFLIGIFSKTGSKVLFYNQFRIFRNFLPLLVVYIYNRK